jgi:DNA polymerase-3 subunit chi
MLPIHVDFYLLQSEEPEASLLAACELVEKLYSEGHRVFIHCNTQQEAEHLDELLWTYQEESFIPHNLQGEGPEPPPPVQLGFGKEPRGFNDILLNMALEVPSFSVKFKRIIELVPSLETEKERSRSRYKEYKSKGFLLQTHTKI